MNNFLKPIRISLRYKWTLLASVLNALLIGVLWGVSITTVYPFVEVIFQGETMESWTATKITESQDRLIELDNEVRRASTAMRATQDPLRTVEINARIESAQEARQSEQRTLAFYQSLQRRFAGFMPSTPFKSLMLIMGLLIAATILKGICLVLHVVLVDRVANRTVMEMRRMFYRDLVRMDQKTIDELGTPQLMTQLSHHVSLVSTGLRMLYGQSIREPFKMAACLIAASCVSWQLLLLSLLVAPPGAFCIHRLSRRMKGAALGEMGGIERIFETLTETLNGIKIVKIFGRERSECRRFKENARTLYRLSMKMSFFDSLIKPITELVGILSLVVAILGGAYLVLNQETHLLGIRISDQPLSAGALFMFFAMLAGISDPARKMGDIYNHLVRGAMASEKLYSIFGKQPTLVAQAPKQEPPLHRKAIRFENVSFAYHTGQRVLQNIELEIPFGQKIALVGANGCGKTTLIHLISRFYDPVEGTIFLDDVNLRNVSPKALRRQIAMVTQDSILFRGTIWDNIAYGNRNATKEQILRAASMAQVEAVIEEFPQGYQTNVGEQGKRLSGGQRQRVALARAIVADPRILILDEATSQVDQHAELDVHDALQEFLKNRTAILVTHRRSTLALADRVVLMESGRIVDDMAPSSYLNYLGSARKIGLAA